ADGAAWRLGHWLNGRAGLSMLGEVVADLCRRAGVEADVAALNGAVSGYVADAPSSARVLIEPLMAAYDFVAAEREGALVFFHRDAADPVSLSLDDLAAESAGGLIAQRADAAAAPIEARVRFLDPSRDYLLAGVGARRLDRAEGGVETLEAPLVLETEAAEAIAQRVLADRRAATETLNIGLGPARMSLEPGDRVVLGSGADVFEIARIEDAEVRTLELRRARSDAFASLSGAEPSAPPTPPLAPTPAVSVLDLPPLPGSEDDDRPLAAVFAAPWLGAHTIYAGPTLTPRAQAQQPALMGELLWALWPGPVDRWDDGNVVRVKLFGGALASAERDAVLAGANVFAIEADGEWEIVQARNCVLVAPGEYELSGFLRGQLGSAPPCARRIQSAHG
ncbi:MAG: phage tail protein, partial [Hyphomonadaceae bacterium]